MSVKAISWVWEHSRVTTSAGELLVLLAMADWADDSGGSIYPAISRIAVKTQLSERQVQRNIAALEQRRVLVREREGRGRGHTAAWTLVMGDNMAPFLEKVTSATKKVTFEARKGDAHVTRSVIDPLDQPPIAGDPFSKLIATPKYPAGKFDEFWNLYPKKTEKKDAQRAWLKVPAGEFPRLMARLKQFIAIDWAGKEKAMIPNPATWLNGERWNDEVIPPATFRNGNSHHPPEPDTPLYHQPAIRHPEWESKA